MMNIFKPIEIIPRFDALDIEKYAKLGYQNIVLDIDNTIAVPDDEKTASKQALAFVENLKRQGFRIFIMSNNTKNRVSPYASSIGCHEYLYWSFKPLPFAYWILLSKFNIDKKNTLTLGDQLITDVIGANIAGLSPIYTKQLVSKDKWMTRINRFFERIIFKVILHEKM